MITLINQNSPERFSDHSSNKSQKPSESKGFSGFGSKEHPIRVFPKNQSFEHNYFLTEERKEYFEALILEIKTRWDFKINRSSINYRSKLYDLSEDLKTYLHSHSIYSNGIKYCSTVFQFEIIESESPLSFLKSKYWRYEDFENKVEEKKDYAFELKLKDKRAIKIKLSEGFIHNHPDKFSQGISIQHPFNGG